MSNGAPRPRRRNEETRGSHGTRSTRTRRSEEANAARAAKAAKVAEDARSCLTAAVASEHVHELASAVADSKGGVASSHQARTPNAPATSVERPQLENADPRGEWTTSRREL